MIGRDEQFGEFFASRVGEARPGFRFAREGFHRVLPRELRDNRRQHHAPENVGGAALRREGRHLIMARPQLIRSAAG